MDPGGALESRRGEIEPAVRLGTGVASGERIDAVDQNGRRTAQYRQLGKGTLHHLDLNIVESTCCHGDAIGHERDAGTVGLE